MLEKTFLSGLGNQDSETSSQLSRQQVYVHHSYPQTKLSHLDIPQYHGALCVERQTLASKFLEKAYVQMLAHWVNKQTCTVVLQTETLGNFDYK